MKSTSLFFLSFRVLSQTLKLHIFCRIFSECDSHLGGLCVLLFISDLLRFKFWILGLPPEGSNPSLHSEGPNLLVDAQGSKS